MYTYRYDAIVFDFDGVLTNNSVLVILKLGHLVSCIKSMVKILFSKLSPIMKSMKEFLVSLNSVTGTKIC